MILATDVTYHNDTAVAAGVVFDEWSSNRIIAEYTTKILGVAPYEPGAFYKRELPCLLELLKVVQEPIHTIVVDGYVDLGPAHPGLGRHLHTALDGKIAVVGVAKTSFKEAVADIVLRGDSRSPLYVTASEGMLDAASLVKGMAGPYRVPLMLKRVDSLSRGR